MSSSEEKVITHEKTVDLSRIRSSFRGSTTWSGLPFDIVKSALQKYIRRGSTEKAVQAAVEMEMFRKVPDGLPRWTNFFNRVRIIYLEDVGLANPGLIRSLDLRLQEWKSRDDPVGQEALVTVIRDLSEGSHSRYFSHLRAGSRSFRVEKAPQLIYPLQQDEDLREWINPLIWCLENREEKGWVYIESILEKETLKTRRKGGFRAGFLIFEILEKFISISPSPQEYQQILSICLSWYKTMKMKEQFLCLIFPFCLLFRSIPKWNEPIFSLRDSQGFEWNPFTKMVPLRVDDFCVDLHTQAGIRAGRTCTDFAVDGSLVCRDIQVSPTLHQLYTQQKMGQVRKESFEFTVKVRAQLVCSAVRQDSYFARTRTGHDVVVKGPYPRYSDLLMLFERCAQMRKYRGVNVVEMGIKYLLPDLFRTDNPTGLGIRTKTPADRPAFFCVMTDLYAEYGGIQEYPTQVKSSKCWAPTQVVDFDKLFSLFPELDPNAIDDVETWFSFAVQLLFRYIFGIGDICLRNFVRVRNRVWNIDLESWGDSPSEIRLSQKVRISLISAMEVYEEELCEILEDWKLQGQRVELIEKVLQNPTLILRK